MSRLAKTRAFLGRYQNNRSLIIPKPFGFSANVGIPSNIFGGAAGDINGWSEVTAFSAHNSTRSFERCAAVFAGHCPHFQEGNGSYILR